MKNLSDLIGQVVTLKLQSGEELVTKILEIMNGEVIIHDPVSVAPGPQGIGLVPSLFTADQKYEPRLNLDSIVIYALTDESVKNKYIQATSNIIMPETKKLILG